MIPVDLMTHSFRILFSEIDLTFFFIGFRWTYADPSWARIAALVPEVVSCAEAGDEIANKVLDDAVQELALSVRAVVQRLRLCGEGAQLKMFTHTIKI